MVAIKHPSILLGEKKPVQDDQPKGQGKTDHRSKPCLVHQEWQEARKRAQEEDRELAVMRCVFVTAVVIAITLMWLMVLFLISKMSSGGQSTDDSRPAPPRDCIFGDYNHVPPGPNDADAEGCTVIGSISANVNDTNGMPILAVVAYWNSTTGREIPCTIDLVTLTGHTSSIRVSNQGNTNSMSVFAMNRTCFGSYRSVSMTCSVPSPGEMMIVACNGSRSLLLFELNNMVANTMSILTMYYS
ncbi:hypothetical protein CRV005 [Nile crocodilepox virus]|uniref:Uncharacterized protein n=1 Tax=Nile crocodilepox virus (isolate Crocodylus niloticus/Zimbabwe/Ume/2001) TaxID=1289473 RepID=Q06ZX5_CPRVZ|nr:hypothetical protein CRV005 [Nile crocodilepox virus]ABJ08896.1 hypothetical protein CRV005 [Nile crocodilepox virus]